ncbi:MAG: metallopeptidase family protein [Gemmatimonadales bacterium]
MVQGLAADIPEEFMDGIAEIVVSPRTLAHPERGEIFTLGECIPLPAPLDDPDTIQSRVVLYYGSFAAMARDQDDFDWHKEAWETLTHEIRHHVEWRAREGALEDLDDAQEENFARMAGEPFDPSFYRAGESLPGGMFRVEDDYFVEVEAPADGVVRLPWGGRRYRIDLPPDLTLPAFLSVLDLEEPPAGEVVVVLVRQPRWWEVLKAPAVDQREVEAVLEV